MSSVLRCAASIVGALRAASLRQRRALLSLAMAAVVGAICMFGCFCVASMSSGYSAIAPGTTPVDTFLVDDKYKAVRIGGVTWMAKNLDIEAGKSWCMYDEPVNCRGFGRLYDWETASNICPAGWHLPTRQEWFDLVTMAGGTLKASVRLKAVKDGGTDDYGFSARPSGLSRCQQIGRNYDCKYKTHAENGWPICTWWTSEKYDEQGFIDGTGTYKVIRAGYIASLWPGKFMVGDRWDDRATGLPVRCVKDE